MPGKLTSPGISKIVCLDPDLAQRGALYSAMRRAFSEPASRDGIAVVKVEMRVLAPAFAIEANTLGHSEPTLAAGDVASGASGDDE